jgi:hypothetical protein
MPAFNRMWVRELAGKHMLDERTLLKALEGKTIRAQAVAERAEAAAGEYHLRAQRAVARNVDPLTTTLSGDDLASAEPTTNPEGDPTS